GSVSPRMPLTRAGRSTREEVADVHCGIGSCGVPRVRVWQITSRRGEPRTGRRPPRVLELPTLLEGGGVPTKDAVQGVPGGRSESLCGRYAHGSGPGRRSEKGVLCHLRPGSRGVLPPARAQLCGAGGRCLRSEWWS